MLVSGDRLTARFMRQDEFEFDPQFTLWIMSNHRAKAPAAEGAFWRRIKVLRYPHSVAEADRIDTAVAADLAARAGAAPRSTTEVGDALAAAVAG